MHKLQEAEIKTGSKVLVRCDLDVPIEDNLIKEKYRLESALKTLRYIISKKAFPIIIGHMGRPEGKVVQKLSTQSLIPFFDLHLGMGKYELRENLRFDPREEKGDLEFAKELATGCDFYVNESFAVSHREHTSFVFLPKVLPAYAGFHLQNEVETLSKLLHSPAVPFLAIIGGAKLESKKPVITKFLEVADIVLVGGKLGLDWNEPIPEKLKLPIDYLEENKDIGPRTLEHFRNLILTAKTILWAGPMGQFEDPRYQEGTKEVCLSLAEAKKNNGATVVAGGGDTLAAIERFSGLGSYTFVSVGGGAMLEYISKGTLPGIEALN